MENIERVMLKALLADIPDSIYFKDVEGKFVMVNNAKAENSQTTVEEMIGKTDFDFMPYSEAEKACLDDREVMQSRQSIRDKIEKLTRPDGRDVSVSVTKIPWRDEEGRIIGLMGISRDVTKRVEMEKNILDMLSIATHDIHGPLVAIEATLKLLIRGSYGAIGESIKSTLQAIWGHPFKGCMSSKKTPLYVKRNFSRLFFSYQTSPPLPYFHLVSVSVFAAPVTHQD